MKKDKIYIIIIGILCFITAASICVQYRSTDNYVTEGQASVQSMTENKLRDKVLEEQENYSNLQKELEVAQTQLEELRKVSAANSEEAKQLEEQLTEKNRLLGYTDVTDSTDQNSSNSLVHNLDLVDVVNELFNAGAEAISINDQRIVSTTSIICNGNIVRINNEKISVPFVIKAIGSPDALYDTMMRPDGYLDLMQDYKIKLTVEKKDDITVPKYSGTIKNDYLQAVE